MNEEDRKTKCIKERERHEQIKNQHNKINKTYKRENK